jgi:hypothetical protein
MCLNPAHPDYGMGIQKGILTPCEEEIHPFIFWKSLILIHTTEAPEVRTLRASVFLLP